MMNFGDLRTATKKATLDMFEQMLQQKFMHQSLCEGFDDTVKISCYELARCIAEKEDLSRNINMCDSFKNILVGWLIDEGYSASLNENSIIVKL